MKLLFKAIRLPLAIAAVNFFVGSVAPIPVFIAEVIFNLIRVLLMLWAGLLVTRSAVGGSGMAALAGVSILLVDHVVLKGGWFLMHHLMDPATLENKGLMAVGGVLVSFVIVLPVALLLGWLGGKLGTRVRVSHAA